MKQLSKSYRKNGYQFNLVERTPDVAIYSQHGEAGIIAYEVFKIQKLVERDINGKTIPAHEATPSNEQWGIKGYTFWKLEQAKEKYNKMQADIENRNLAKRHRLEKNLETILDILPELHLLA